MFWLIVADFLVEFKILPEVAGITSFRSNLPLRPHFIRTTRKKQLKLDTSFK